MTREDAEKLAMAILRMVMPTARKRAHGTDEAKTLSLERKTTMEFKIDTKTRKEIDAARIVADEKRAALCVACETFNTEMKQQWGQIDDALTEYNAARQVLAELVEQKASALRAEFDERSGRWQQGDRGQEVDSWIGQVESVALDIADDVILDEPDALDADIPDVDAVANDLHDES